MTRLRYWLPVAVFTLLILGISLRTTEAQINVETCPTIIEDALNAVGNNCGGLDRNSACYGNNLVEARFTEALGNDFFSRPADRSPISSISTISTTPLETALGEWGIALLSIQANLPDTLPGQNAVFMLLGETELENAVDPQDTYIPGAIISVTPSMGVDLHYQPDLNAEIVGNIAGGTTVSADAITADGEWLRVTVGENFGWVLTSLVTTTDDLSTLGVIGPNTRTPMQAFYLTGVAGDNLGCTQAPPNGLLIQTPEGVGHINLRANDVDISLGSTAYLQAAPRGELSVNVLQGQGEVRAFGRTVVVPAGSRVAIPLNEDMEAVGAPEDPEPYDLSLLDELPIEVLPEEFEIADPIDEEELLVLQAEFEDEQDVLADSLPEDDVDLDTAPEDEPEDLGGDGSVDGAGVAGDAGGDAGGDTGGDDGGEG